VADNAGGAILTWIDERSGYNHVHAQRLEMGHGEWGHPEPRVAAVDDNPNDQGGYVVVKWNASGRDKLPENLITHYSVWRATEPPEEGLPEGNAATRDGVQPPLVSSPGAIGPDFDGRAVWLEVNRAGQQQYWEWVANQNAHYQPHYSYTAPTRGDSVGGNTNVHYFKVMSHTSDQFVFWESAPREGYSVDNLAPAAPLTLTAQRVGADVLLDWNPSGEDELDFSLYAVYRGTESGVTADPIFFLDNEPDTVYTDTGAPTSALYYIVTALDVHGNESEASNEASVGGTGTGVGPVPKLTTLQVSQNTPNPFSTGTAFRIGLPSPSDVMVEVYDVAGRRVFVERMRSVPSGWQDFDFVGADASGRRLSSGVYFYRVTAVGTTVTKKMVIAR
jgi:hypothetical protein